MDNKEKKDVVLNVALKQIGIIVNQLGKTLIEALKSLDEFNMLNDLQKSLVVLTAIESLYIEVLTVFLGSFAEVPEEIIRSHFNELADAVITKMKGKGVNPGSKGFSYN